MKAVFLIGSYVPHQLVSINKLIEEYEIEIHSYSISNNFTYIPKQTTKFIPYKFNDYTKKDALQYILALNPSFIVVSGWMIHGYVWICKQVKKTTNIPIVAMSDTPWYGTWKQKINTTLSPFHLRKAFTHLWVAGIRQYEYARRLGFANEQIIFNSLSADTSIFHKVDIKIKMKKYPKNFLYIGRYTQVKGLRNLMLAWSAIIDKKGWTFTLIGEGEMKEELKETGQFIVKDYMAQDLLLQEMQNSGCFVLPSLKEPWALVIHEAAAAGLPILCTETCGAAPHFVINKYNGFRIKDNSIEDLKNKLEMIINTSDLELLEYCNRSRELSSTINPDIQSASLMQLIYADKKI